MHSKTVRLGTDVATLCLFHPDDLAHRSGDPIAWYSYPFAYEAESRAGRLVAFATGSDGAYEVRLTTGALTPEEERRRCAGWTYPLDVRHGRVFLDNTDALPGEERMTDPDEEPERWFDLPSGYYRVTVHPIAAAEDGVDDPDVPDYVVAFEPTTDLAEIAAAQGLPELRPIRDWRPVAGARFDGPSPYDWPREEPPRTGSALFLSLADDVPFLPGRSTRLTVDDAIVSAIFGDEDASLRRSGERPVVLGPLARPGALAVLARPSGVSRFTGEAPRLAVHGEHLVRLGSVRAGPAAPLANFAPLDRPASAELDPMAIEAFKARAVAYASQPAMLDRPSHPSFERELLQALRTVDAMTGWLIAHLDVPAPVRIALYALPDDERMRVLDAVFAGADPAGLLPLEPSPPHDGWLARLRRLFPGRS